MATRLERAEVKVAGRLRVPGAGRAMLALGPLAVALAVWGLVLSWNGGPDTRELIRSVLVVGWALAGAAMARMPSAAPLGRLLLGVATLGGAGTLAAGVLDGAPGDDTAALVRALAAALLPAAGMHLLLALPDGRLGRRKLRAAVAVGYALGAGVGVLLWLERPSLSLWPIAVEWAVAFAVGVIGANARYKTLGGLERRRMQWVAWAIAAAAELTLVAAALRILVGWPPHASTIAAVATVPIPIAFAFGASPRVSPRVDRLLVHTLSLTGLTGLVVAVYFVIVLGLGRVPTDEERWLLLLSMVAAGVAAILYAPARDRLVRFASRLVYGKRGVPDEVLRTFGSRLSRAIPLDELLLQLAESMRRTLALDAAEIWTGSEGVFERAVSDPEREPARVILTPTEESVVKRAGVSGPGWLAVWLPRLAAGRGDAVLRVAPVAHSGELFGLIVAERPADGLPFADEDERVLAELARQIGLALRNVRLDSALQASLDELRRQAEELRASRARVVAAADAERRRIERDIHDGAQQHLVALAVKLGLVRQLADSDPGQGQAMLAELQTDIDEALDELRDLAHGIYPPLLLDRGLRDALAAAAARAPLRARVEATAVGRYSPEVEATVYFCCLEALQNAAKYAGEGARARIRVWEEEGALLFEAADDGLGFDPERQPRGAGLTNMGDRLGALGGSLRVESSSGGGTRVGGTIPLDR